MDYGDKLPPRPWYNFTPPLWRIFPPPLTADVYGGRVCIAWDGQSCLHCLHLLDQEDVRRYLSGEVERARVAAVYGVPHEVLGESGPSVSPINGLVASFAATEFMMAATGMREPGRLINYAGHLFRLTQARARDGDCPYCIGVRGQGSAAEVERYLKMPHLASGRAQMTTDSGRAGEQ